MIALLVLAFLGGAVIGYLVGALASMAADDRSTACRGTCEQGRHCDCVPKIGYPTEEES